MEDGSNGAHEARVATRWTDFDALGHLTHSVVFQLLDEARDRMLSELVGGLDAWPYVVAHADADFRREVPVGPRELVIRTRIAELGGSSVRFRQELLTPDGEVAVEGDSVLVAFDPAERRARPLSAEDRARFLAT